MFTSDKKITPGIRHRHDNEFNSLHWQGQGKRSDYPGATGWACTEISS